LQDNRINISDKIIALKFACKYGASEIVEIISGTNYELLNIDNNYPIKAAIENANIEIVKMLLYCNHVDPGSDNNISIHYCNIVKTLPIDSIYEEDMIEWKKFINRITKIYNMLLA